ncbi:uridylate kinase [candidate division TA06 bacterium DG_26]|uniref:Uridylate kinase n=1 Tax=candidate division TA06 bacterium DG_26 TaxID=1703771 RepID=A0A0S7WM11_UNCT6|nr:MAG: uridylate kinase [candidate division TA06 bacterium DG_26]
MGGEVFSSKENVIDKGSLEFITRELQEGLATGTALGIVVGGGNVFRGQRASDLGMDRVTGDYIGMLGTMIDSLALQDSLVQKGIRAKVMSAIEMSPISERFAKEKAICHLEQGYVLIFSCGTGNPYFTTDTAASLRAVEVEADVLLKGTKVNGVYSDDPMKDPQARRFGRLCYLDVLTKRLGVMDATAVSLCMDHKLPVIVFDIYKRGNLRRVLSGEDVGTLITD